MSPPPKAIEMVVFVTFLLKYEARTLDYCEIFTPTSFIYTILIDPPPTFLLNILSWNVKGVADVKFKRVFRQLVATHRPDGVILTETCVSGEKASAILAILGFDRYVKVDAMGIACGI